MTRAYTSTRLGIALLVALLCTWFGTPLRGQTTEQYTPVPNFPGFALNGPVFAMQEVGDLIYVGGNFTQATTRFTQNGLLMTDINRGGVLSGFPNITGFVEYMIPDGRGGWYLFGRMQFQEGTGYSRPYWGLRVTNALAVDPAFRFEDQTGGRGRVYSVLESGTDIYVAVSATSEYFVNVYSIPKHNPQLQLIVEQLGYRYKPYLGYPDYFNQQITSISLGVFGKYLIVAGGFNHIAHTDRENILAYDLVTNSVSSDFTFDFSDQGIQVNDILLMDGKLWLGGSFSYQNQFSAIAYLDLQGNFSLPSLPVSGYVYDLENYGNFVFAAGNFNGSDPTQNEGLRVFDRITEQVISWGSPVSHSRSYCYIRQVKAIGNTVFLAGSFDRYGSITRNGFVALNAWDGTLATTPSYPQPSDQVYSLGISGNRILMSGFFAGINPVDRPYLLAFNKNTGAPVNWNSRANGPVYDLAYDGTNLVVGGDFTSIGGASRSRIAVLNATNRSLRSTTINANARVNQVATNGTLIALAGDFTEVNGAPRQGVALANRSTSALSSFAPSINNFYSSSYPEYERFSGLAFGSRDLYVTGSFNTVNNLSKIGFVAFDLNSFSISETAPQIQANYQCSDVAVDQGTVYVAGYLAGYHSGSDFIQRNLLIAFDDVSKTVSQLQLPQYSFRQFYSSNMRIAFTSDRILLHGGFSVEFYGPDRQGFSGLLQLRKIDWSFIPSNLTFYDWPVLETFPGYRFRYAGLVALVPASNGRLYVGGANGLTYNGRLYDGALGAYELAAPTPQAPTTELSTIAALPNSDTAPDSTTAPTISLSPNPTPGPATLTLTLPQAASVGVEVITASGQSVPLFREQPFPQGTHAIPITVQPGSAQVVIRVNGRPYVERILRF